ncbi:MAG: hypothetical protein OMM_00906 [Candidatus Magnetoglobus multicellularis str. Araruama]|uniref:DUF3782 domain-containing protein n=1 Tax=Candidatus Magnetoglobus multicellularis str. Araruama TaxID=890399 RepID=A0A1V1PFG8_9BACT|nr:MAG: hypothetical protein OMM_00906 [Candidatus Magnetoglobus multicellularis str. Araruama]
MKEKLVDYQDVMNSLQEYIEVIKEGERQHQKQIKENDRLLKELIKENDRLLKERIKETDRQVEENDRQLKERIKETDRQVEENHKLLNKIAKENEKLNNIVGGIGNSNGFYAEDVFYSSFAKTRTIKNMMFDCIYRNLGCRKNGLEDEFDIVCLNTSVAVIIETKYNYHPNDVASVLRKVDNFRILYPQYKDYNIFGGIAGLSIRKETIDVARQLGLFVFTQEGNDIKILNDQVKEISYN